MPIMAAACAELTAHRFSIVKCERRGGLASLVIKSRSPFKVRAWLYFRIHQSFGPLLTSERVFWMYSVMDTNGAEFCRPGRLQDLNDKAAAGAVINDFVATCKSLA